MRFNFAREISAINSVKSLNSIGPVQLEQPATIPQDASNPFGQDFNGDRGENIEIVEPPPDETDPSIDPAGGIQERLCCFIS